MSLASHASQRAQQRSIPPQIIEWLMAFGTSVRAHSGDLVYFDKKGRRNLRRQLGTSLFAKVETQLDTFAIVGDDGEIKTVGRRYKPIHKDLRGA